MEEQDKKQSGEEQLKKDAKSVWAFSVVILLLLIAWPFLASQNLGALILLPIALIMALAALLLLGIPAKKAIVVALTATNSRKKRAIFGLLVYIPYLLLVAQCVFVLVEIKQDQRGNDPERWETLFYQNEDLLNTLNRTVMNPEGDAAWYIVELHAAKDNTTVEVVVARRESGAILEQGELQDSKYVSGEAAADMMELLKRFRVPFSEIHFRYNAYTMSKSKGIHASFTVGEEYIEPVLHYNDDAYVNGQWYLYGVAEPQYFDNPPYMYGSFLPEQTTAAQ